MTTCYLSPIGNDEQYLLSSGAPNAGGKIYTYAGGTSTPQATYTLQTGLVQNANPTILDAAGRPQTAIWLTAGVTYKFVITDSLGNQLGVTHDNIDGINDPPAASGTAATLSGNNAFTGNNTLTNNVPAISVDVYTATDAAGISAQAIKSTPGGGQNLEQYAVFVEDHPLGDGTGAVVKTDYAFGISAVKQNWASTTQKGEVCGQNIVVRGGYLGAYSSGNGDIAGTLYNVVVSSTDYAAQIEGVTQYAPSGGAASNSLRTQIGVCNQANSVFMGYYALAETGTNGNAVLIAESGSSVWSSAFKYVDHGTNILYELKKFSDGGGAARLYNPTGAKYKTLHVNNTGAFALLDSAESTELMTVSEAGDITAHNLVIGNNIGQAMAAYVPVFTPATGSITAYTVDSADYTKLGKFIFFDVYFRITNAGTGAGALNMTLPTNMTAGDYCSGVGYNSAGKMMYAAFQAAGTLKWSLYDATTAIATSATGLHVSGYYESAT